MTIEHEIIIGRSGTGMSISPQFLQSLLSSQGEEHKGRFHFQIFDVGESCEEITAESSGNEYLS
ncbi:hypothetical protein [Acidithiobacillus ferriphilus]|uniref:hypothetical protein n=1 Tax=Acidithiobacillus ferriphilus TaxID=1689834 RepID=UPI001C070BA0|nr:hypothetical protein [Acidithiobacillus ferriphilus]MBU2854404.1 hypothetical protein [Acidithiobacillus ferriphilus]